MIRIKENGNVSIRPKESGYLRSENIANISNRRSIFYYNLDPVLNQCLIGMNSGIICLSYVFLLSAQTLLGVYTHPQISKHRTCEGRNNEFKSTL